MNVFAWFYQLHCWALLVLVLVILVTTQMAVTCRPLGREGRRPPSTLTWVLSSHCQWWDPFPFSRTKLGLNPFQQDEIVTPSISPGQNCDSFPFNRTKLGLLPFQQDKIGTPSLSTGQNWNPFLSVGQSWTLSTGQNCDSVPFDRTKFGTPSLSTGQNWNPFLSVGQNWTLSLSTGQNCDSFPFNRTKLGLLPFQQLLQFALLFFFFRWEKRQKSQGQKFSRENNPRAH